MATHDGRFNRGHSQQFQGSAPGHAPANSKRLAPQEWASGGPADAQGAKRAANGNGSSAAAGTAAIRPLVAPACPVRHVGHQPEPEPEMYIVYANGHDPEQHVAIKTLTGEYIEVGENHGRKVYKKAQKVGPKSIEVLLYFWESGECDTFTGWWFGNKLGGTQVWAHCRSEAQSPPGTGWKIPWDGSVREVLVVENKEAQLRQEFEEQHANLEAEVLRAEADGAAALEKAKVTAGDRSCQMGLVAGEKLLSQQALVHTELLRKVTDAQHGTTGEASKALQKLGSRLRGSQTFLNNEYASLKSSRQRAEQEYLRKDNLESETRAFEEMLPDLREKTDLAEDEVEKLAIAKELVDSLADDPETVKSILSDTDLALKAVQLAMSEAKRILNANLVAAKRFVVSSVRALADEELGKIQERLATAQERLVPLRTIRQDLVQRQLAQKMVEEVEDKLVLAELAVEAAEELGNLLQVDQPTKELLTEAQTAARVVEERLNETTRMVEIRKQKASAGTAAAEALKEIESRIEALRIRQATVKESLKEAAERITAASYVTEGLAKQAVLAEFLATLEELEARFGQDALDAASLEEALLSVRTSEASLASAQVAMTTGKSFLQMKLLEVKRFSHRASGEGTKALQVSQRELEGVAKRLAELKALVTKRKSRALIKEVDLRVERAEQLALKAKQAADLWSDEDRFAVLTNEELKEASENAVLCEREANQALIEARKLIATHQLEAKSKEWSTELTTELIKFQTRLASAQGNVERQRKLLASVEQRSSLKMLITEASKKIKDVEDKVNKISEAIVALDPANSGQDRDPKEESALAKAADAATQEAHIAARTVTLYLESQARLHVYAKDALAKFQPRMKQMQDSIEAHRLEVKQRTENIFVRSVLKAAQQKVAETTEMLQKASETEALLREGSTSSSDDGQAAEKAGRLIADLERAIQAGIITASRCKSDVSMQKFPLRRLDSISKDAAEKELGAYLASIEASAKALADMRTRASNARQELFKQRGLEAKRT